MTHTQTADETRKLILQTAREHLRRFGEGKMTIVDVAKSLGMSHANVYRYFRNKAEILDAIVDEWLAKVEALLEPITKMPASAAHRIELVVLEIYRRRRQKLEADAEVFETFRRMIATRPDAVARRIKRIDDVFRLLLKEGIENGEFKRIDVVAAALALDDATTVFLHPLMTSSLMSDTSEARVVNVVRLVLAGFRHGAELPESETEAA